MSTSLFQAPTGPNTCKAHGILSWSNTHRLSYYSLTSKTNDKKKKALPGRHPEFPNLICNKQTKTKTQHLSETVCTKSPTLWAQGTQPQNTAS